MAFVDQEYDYYDAIPSKGHNHISPKDVIVTAAMNSQLTAGKIRSVHREMSKKCDPILGEIPADASLLNLDVDEPLLALLEAACSVRFVLVPVATKILHRKRRDLIPILDNVVMRHYVGEKGVRRAQNKIHAPGIGMECLGSFRTDLAAAGKELQTILDSQSFRLTGVRALEALIWMEVEPSGSYRT